jgi:hypothetical protein
LDFSLAIVAFQSVVVITELMPASLAHKKVGVVDMFAASVSGANYCRAALACNVG